MALIRSFIAIDTPAEVKERVSEVQESLKKTGAEVRWEPREKLHITLKFLGGVERETLDHLANKMTEQLGDFPTIELIYKGTGCFPNRERPRVIWIGAHNESGSLKKLYTILEDTFASFGFEREERAFHPHITIGRVKGTRNLNALLEALDRLEFEPQHAAVTEVLLMKSDLKPTGSVYTVQQRFSLKLG
jgi:2'-5' RNA ligase